MLLPFSLRQLPQTKHDHVLNNDVSSICFSLPLRAAFEDAIRDVSTQTRALKNSWTPFGNHALQQVIAACPPWLAQTIVYWLSNKATVVLSSVPGTKTGYKYDGCESTGVIALLPGLCDISFGISAASMRGRLYMAITADEVIVENPQEIKDLIEQYYDEQLALVKKSTE